MNVAKRKPIIAGNWKMFNNLEECVALADAVKKSLSDEICDVIVAPSYPFINAVKNAVKASKISVSAQDVYFEQSGAFTGAVSPSQAKSAGADFAIVGHSERRSVFGDTDADINKKIKAALSVELRVILCVGETLPEREAGKEKQVVKTQISRGLDGISREHMRAIVIAYEPVWAIGTGKTATPGQAQEMHSFIRGEIENLFGAETAGETRILYGGSVKPDNIDELMKETDIDGALVGGASLKAESFARIIHFKQ